MVPARDAGRTVWPKGHLAQLPEGPRPRSPHCGECARRHWPHRGTVCEILSRHGLVSKKQRRRVIGHPGKPTSQILAPNDVWSADFKGQFKTTNGVTATRSPSVMATVVFCWAVKPYAPPQLPMPNRSSSDYSRSTLPQRIRTDNGVPFATNTLGRLSQLSAWWVRLGVIPEFIEPGKPQQNGRHERMHRTLKAETTRPAAANLAAQQRKFNAFRQEFNQLRPHEALDLETPATCYTPSLLPMPQRLPASGIPRSFRAAIRQRQWRDPLGT